MKKILFSLTLLCVLGSGIAQNTCLFGGYSFDTQAKIDNFSINYPDCTEIGGVVNIGADIASDITNLNGLAQLTSVGRTLHIYNNPLLEDLTGLDNITNVEEDILIEDNSGLISLQGLNGLTYVNDRLHIINNTNLQSLNGLNNLLTIGNILLIRGNINLQTLDGLDAIIEVNSLAMDTNPLLTNIDALINLTSINGGFSFGASDLIEDLSGISNITSVGLTLNIANIKDSHWPYFNSLTHVGGLTIHNSPGITDLAGLSNLVSIENILRVSSCDNLQHLSGLDNITNVGGNLSIAANDSLLDLLGLDQLQHIGGGLNISSNDNLLSLQALSNLITVGGDISIINLDILESLAGLHNIESFGYRLDITDCPMLTSCSLELFCERILGGEGFTNVDDNGEGCDSENDILDNCLNLGFSGYIFYDFNQNQERDEFEAGIAMQAIGISPTGQTIFTNQHGRYFERLEEGQTYTFTLEDNPDWNLTTSQNAYTVNFDEGSTDNQNNDFGVYPTFSNHNYGIDISATQARCSTNAKFFVDVCNRGTFLESGESTISFTYNDIIEFVSASPSPVEINEANRTLTWSYDELYPWQCLSYELTFAMPGVENIGNLAEVQVTANRNENGNQVVAQTKDFGTEVLCSYDPNDKIARPDGAGEQHFTLFGEPLEYTIRFQNTGNISAIDVTLLDTLDTDLDWSTFRVQQSSHDVQTTLSPEGALSFYFKDIYLPDSISDPLGSQGFLRYTIEHLPNLDDSTTIENTAYIYFDSNPPIITNTTLNTLVNEIPVTVVDFASTQQYTVFPNPTSGMISLEALNYGLNSKLHMEVLNNLGQHQLFPINRIENNHAYELDLSAFPSGRYALRIWQEDTGTYETHWIMKL